MMIPIRAVYKRDVPPGEPPVLLEADYADVPVELIIGTAAQGMRDSLRISGQEKMAERVDIAIENACEAGAMMVMGI